MRRPPKPEAISRGFLDACLAELDALKPGNVHRLAAGHNMTVDDFVASAEAAAPIMGETGLAVGQRIRLAVEATRKAVGQNTNLGIVLLAAPLANAALHARRRRSRKPAAPYFARAQRRRCTGEPIGRSARRNPAGLATRPSTTSPRSRSVTLLEAMRAAETRDRIAWNYAHGFADIFTLGLKWLAHARERWAEPSWAVTRVYLGFLAHLPDTLIERKFGTRTATLVREEAGPIEASLTACQSPEAMTAPLAAFDRALKQRGLNPGTSADLTVATLFAAALLALDRPE